MSSSSTTKGYSSMKPSQQGGSGATSTPTGTTSNRYMEAVRNTASRAQYGLRAVFSLTMETIRTYTARYPPLAAFLVTVVATSAVPVGIFSVFTLGSFGCLLTVAVIAVGLLQGGVLAVSGTALAAALVGCLFLSAVLVAGLAVAWTVLYFVRGAYRRVRNQGVQGLPRPSMPRMPRMPSMPSMPSPSEVRPVQEEIRRTGEQLKSAVKATLTTPVTSYVGLGGAEPTKPETESKSSSSPSSSSTKKGSKE